MVLFGRFLEQMWAVAELIFQIRIQTCVEEGFRLGDLIFRHPLDAFQIGPAEVYPAKVGLPEIGTL